MTTRKPGLVFITCVCMVQLVTYTNGEVTPPWITLLGCFKDDAVTQSRTLSNNSATNCFKECTTSTFIGIQKNNCICRMTFTSITDVQNAAIQPFTRCSRGDNGFMSVYAKVSSLPSTINQDADYGYVYVNILSPTSYEYHASNDSNEWHYFICYDNLRQCAFRSGGLDQMDGASAWSECNLVSFYDLDSCLEKVTGLFWIGMYRDSPYFISTLSTLSTRASTSTSTSTSTSSTTPQFTTETPTPLTIATTDTSFATSLKVETIKPANSSFRPGNITSTDFISTLSTLSTRSSTSISTSTSSATPQLTTVTSTPLTIATTDTPSATSLKMETITPTTSSFRTENITSTVASTSESHGLPFTGIAGGISAGVVIILVVVIGIILCRRYQLTKKNQHENDVTGEDEERTRRNQINDVSVKHDVIRGIEYEGLNFTKAEATQYLHLNDLSLEENTDPKARFPEGESYEKLHPYVNSDIKMYSSLKIPKTYKDSETKYENTWIKELD